MVIDDPKIDNPILHLVGETADELGLECYVIGGWVRDLLLHRESTDIDVVCLPTRPRDLETSTSRPGIMLAEAVAKKLGRGAHLSIFKTYGTAQVKKRLPVTGDGLREVELEFVGARKESYQHDSRNPIVEDGTLQEDQERRDFTINAMGICLNNGANGDASLNGANDGRDLQYGELLDPFDGIGDLERGIIKTPLDPDITFSDDPLRMMRAIRFATQLGFNLDGETFDAIARNKERMSIITRERIAEELNKIILSRRPSEGFILLDKTGLDKEMKARIMAIEGKLARVARLARALGIHLIIATQRPDANIISGQIKNNLYYRLCGRADDVLSQIILDNTLAADDIPKDGQGLFMNQDGMLIKGYYMAD